MLVTDVHSGTATQLSIDHLTIAIFLPSFLPSLFIAPLLLSSHLSSFFISSHLISSIIYLLLLHRGSSQCSSIRSHADNALCGVYEGWDEGNCTAAAAYMPSSPTHPIQCSTTLSLLMHPSWCCRLPGPYCDLCCILIAPRSSAPVHSMLLRGRRNDECCSHRCLHRSLNIEKQNKIKQKKGKTTEAEKANKKQATVFFAQLVASIFSTFIAAIACRLLPLLHHPPPLPFAYGSGPKTNKNEKNEAKTVILTFYAQSHTPSYAHQAIFPPSLTSTTPCSIM